MSLFSLLEGRLSVSTMSCGMQESWVYTLTLLFTLWPWAEFLEVLLVNVLIWVNEYNYTFSARLY